MKQFRSTLVLLVLPILTLSAQPLSRFSINSSFGVNHMWSTMGTEAGTTWSNTLTFTPHHLFTIELENERASVKGRNRVVNGDGSSGVFPFRTSFDYWGGNVGINLFKLFTATRRPGRVTPILYGGVGFMDFTAERLDKPGINTIKRFSYNTYTTKIGLRLRIRINEAFDWLAAVETTTPQSYYVDANPVPKGYDRLSSVKLGLSYKIGASKKRPYIDQSYYGRRQARSDWFY